MKNRPLGFSLLVNKIWRFGLRAAVIFMLCTTPVLIWILSYQTYLSDWLENNRESCYQSYWPYHQREYDEYEKQRQISEQNNEQNFP